MRSTICIVALLAIVAIVCVAGEESAKPCKKDAPSPLLSIEQRYPTLVKDYHPVDNAIDPNAIDGKEADRTARVIIREHLEWEKENPAPPKQFSTEELKELGQQVEQQTLEIKKEGKQFDALAKFVHNDDLAYKAAEAAAKIKADQLAKQKVIDAAKKAESQALLKQVAAKRQQVAAANAKIAAERAAKKAAAEAKKNGQPAPAASKINKLKAKVTKK